MATCFTVVTETGDGKTQNGK